MWPRSSKLAVSRLTFHYKKEFGLKYKIGVPRVSEKIHEIMVSKEEAPRTFYSEDDDTYYMHYKEVYSDCIADEFSSHETTVSHPELIKILNNYDFFRP